MTKKSADFEQKSDDPSPREAGRSSSFPGGSRIANGRISIGHPPSGRIMLANYNNNYSVHDRFTCVEIVEAELRPDGTAEVLFFKRSMNHEVPDLLTSDRRHLGGFMLTDDHGEGIEREGIATNLVIFLPNPALPKWEQRWVYRIRNPAPLCGYTPVLPPLDCAREPPPLTSSDNVTELADIRSSHKDSMPEAPEDGDKAKADAAIKRADPSESDPFLFG
jgi:hypothetical protein